MAEKSIYTSAVHHGMPVAERMALAMSHKSREEWGEQPGELHDVFGSMALRMLVQAADPTPAVLAHVKARLANDSVLSQLTDEQLTEVWDALIGGISAEAQNIANGYSRDGGPKPDES